MPEFVSIRTNMAEKINLKNDFLLGLFNWYIGCDLIVGLTNRTKLLNIMILPVPDKFR